MFDTETPTPSRRTIPPVALSGETLAPPPPPPASAWLWVIGALWLAVMVPLGMRWYAGQSTGASASAAAAETEMVSVQWVGDRAVVPESAVTRVEGKATVFVAERDLRLLVATPVELGARHGGSQEIVSGVSRGQLVVTDATSTQRALAAR